jgi:hypothetical protein
MCIYDSNQIWCIDSAYNFYVFSCKTYSKITQYYIDLSSMQTNIISMHPFETTNQILICSSNGILIFLDLNIKQSSVASIDKNKNNNNEIEYLLYDLSVKIYSTIILPTRYDKKYSNFFFENFKQFKFINIFKLTIAMIYGLVVKTEKYYVFL